MERSVVAEVLRGYRLIGAFDLAVDFLGRERWRNGGEAHESSSLEGPAWAGGEGGGGGGVGMWESGRLDATGRRLFVFCGREEEVEGRKLNFLFYLLDGNPRAPGSF